MPGFYFELKTAKFFAKKWRNLFKNHHWTGPHRPVLLFWEYILPST
jgi:hypothetical protein